MMKKLLPLIIAFTGSMSLAYFWEDWGKQVSPQEKIEKEKADLKYQEKTADVNYKQQKARSDVYGKQQKLEHKKQELELDRQKARLKAEQKY